MEPSRHESRARRPRASSAASRWARALGLASLVGVAAGLAAFALATGLHFFTERLVGRVSAPTSAAFWQPSWELLLLPALGAIVSGLAVRLLVGRVGGQGTDAMVHAFHREDGRLPLTGAAVKATASVATIASGGSAGPEGPSAALGAAIGSTAGRLAGVTPREQRTLLVSGCAAAVGAIFGCPLGGALFAASVLYRRPEFEGTSLVSAFVASAVGYTTFSQVWGEAPRVLAQTGGLEFSSAVELPLYALLGMSCGLMAIFFGACIRAGEAGFARLSFIPSGLRPGLGGLVTGALACALPQVIDGEYRVVQSAFDGSFFGDAAPEAWLGWAGFLALIALVKCVATGSTLGSGAPGGVLGPSLAIGGYVGAAFGLAATALLPGGLDESLRQALIPVGMAGVLAAAMRTPIAAMAMVMEMTGSFGLIVPLMLCTMTAYVVGGSYGLVAAQTESAADSPAHAGDAVVSMLERMRVAEVVDAHWPYTARPATPLGALLRDLAPGVHPTFAVLDGTRLAGTIGMRELQHVLGEPDVGGAMIAADLLGDSDAPLAPDDSLYEAVHRFAELGAEALPVVTRSGGDIYAGMLSRAAVFASVRDQMNALQQGFRREHAALAGTQELAYLVDAMSATETRGVERIPVAHDWVGRSLRELDFRSTHGAEVLAVQNAAGAITRPPDPTAALRAGEVLLVMRGARPGDPEAG